MEANDVKGIHAEIKKRMDGQIEFVRKELAGVRTGRASTDMLAGVMVDAYGSKMPINQVASLSVPEPALIVAQPFDPSIMAAIERAFLLVFGNLVVLQELLELVVGLAARDAHVVAAFFRHLVHMA